MSPSRATARAHPNIALVKYWGKRDPVRILPHQSSLSVTLAPLEVVTTVEFGAPADSVVLHGSEARGKERARVLGLLERVRAETTRALGPVRVDSRGNFPMAAGLASSAAGFVATQAFAEGHWPELRLLVAVLSRAEKEVGSRDGMAQTVETSPYYPAWVKDAEAEIPRATAAIAARDLEALGALSERNAWRMHATAFAADPPLCYLLPGTLGLILALPAARRRGVPVWFTLDAGPNPVLVTLASHEAEVERLARDAGALDVVRCRPGGDARLVEP